MARPSSAPKMLTRTMSRDASSSEVAAVFEQAAILVLHFIDDFIGALELLGRLGVGVLLQQIVGADLAFVNLLVFLNESIGEVGVPVVLDGFDAVQSRALAGVGCLGLRPRAEDRRCGSCLHAGGPARYRRR